MPRIDNLMQKMQTRKTLLLSIALLFAFNGILFRQTIFSGKVPVAFDFAVYTYQPWKLDFEETFSQALKKIGHDDIRIFYPQRKFIIESLKSGIFPFWNPYEFAGNVSLANSQTATFYPPFLLFFILPQIVAWSLLSFSIPLIAGIGMLLYLRGIFRSDIPATFGAIVFAFSSSIITRTQDGLVAGHSIIWLPWVLFGIEALFGKKRFASLVIGSALILSMLAGWFQFTFYVYFVGGIYALLLWYSEKELLLRKKLVTVAIIFAASIFLTAFHWLPAVEALRHSPRGVLETPTEFATKHLMPVSHLATLLIPNFFGNIGKDTYFGASEFKEGTVAVGLVPFLLALVGILEKLREKRVRIFSLFLLGSLLVGLKTPVAKWIIQMNLPLISTFLPNRSFIVASFSLAVLSAYGLKVILAGKTQRLKKIGYLSAAAFMALYVAVAAFYLYERELAQKVGTSFFEKGIERFVRISIAESMFPALMLIILLLSLKITGKRRGKLLLSVIVITTLTSLVVRAGSYLYFSDREHEFPDNPIFSYLQEKTQKDKSRFLSLSFSKIPSNIPTYYSLYYPEGVDALYPIWYGEFSYYFRRKSPWIGQDMRIDVSFSEDLEKPVKYGESRWIDPGTINFLSHLGIRYLVMPRDYHDLPPLEAFSKVFEYKWHSIYEYKYAFPKAYFVPGLSLSKNKSATLQRIFHPNFYATNEVTLTIEDKEAVTRLPENRKWIVNNLDLLRPSADVIELNKKSRFAVVEAILKKFEKNPVEVIEYTPNKIILQANVRENGFIVLNDSYFPGWKAEVDGESQPIYRANHAFRAVPVSEGSHLVTFSYRPSTFDMGSKISGIAAVVLTGGFVIKRKRKGFG